jgi:hypothetical protein
MRRMACVSLQLRDVGTPPTNMRHTQRHTHPKAGQVLRRRSLPALRILPHSRTQTLLLVTMDEEDVCMPIYCRICCGFACQCTIVYYLYVFTSDGCYSGAQNK